MTDSLPPNLETGIPGIDAQHRALLNWAAAIRSVGTAPSEQATARRAARFLIAYTHYHFDAEEYAMVASAYDGLDKHRRAHVAIRKRLNEVSKAFNTNLGDCSAAVTLLQDLIQEWLQFHISRTDVAFAKYCEQEESARAVRLPSPKELVQTGRKVPDYEQVEIVHDAGEISAEELKARMGKRTGW